MSHFASHRASRLASRFGALCMIVAWVGVRAGCWYDETWGFDARGIWVSNGCRADFLIRG